jgi:hypothetical protein
MMRRTTRPTLLSLFCCFSLVNGLPYYLLSSSRPLCVSVEGPRETSLLVQYHAPDLILLPEDDSARLSAEEQKQKEAALSTEDGLDARFNQQYKTKMEQIKKAGRIMSDMSIVMQQRGDTVGGIANREWRRRDKLEGGDGVARKEGTGRIREELDKREGSFVFMTGRFDGPVEVCLQSMAATTTAPVRIAINVTQHVDKQADNLVWQRRQQKSKDTADAGAEKAKAEFSRMAADLRGLERKVMLTLNNADYAKDQERNFHEQSIAMNRASQYWPMIHVAILLVTGFTQANHIVRFFRTHHIM